MQHYAAFHVGLHFVQKYSSKGFSEYKRDKEMNDCIVGVRPFHSDCLDVILSLGFVKYVDCSGDSKIMFSPNEASIM